jgi:hypothetical protein
MRTFVAGLQAQVVRYREEVRFWRAVAGLLAVAVCLLVLGLAVVVTQRADTKTDGGALPQEIIDPGTPFPQVGPDVTRPGSTPTSTSFSRTCRKARSDMDLCLMSLLGRGFSIRTYGIMT